MTTIDFSGFWRQLGVVALGALLVLPTSPAQAAGTLRIAMTTSDIPLPNG